MITWRFIVWLFLLFASIITSHFKLRLFPHVIILFLILIPIVSLIFLFLLKKKLKISLTSNAHRLTHRQQAEFILNISNESKWQPVFMRLIREKVPKINISLNPNQHFSYPIHKSAQHVGYLEPPQFELQLYDAFKLFRVGIYLNDVESLLVLPRLDSQDSSLEVNQNLVEDIRQALVVQHAQQDELQAIREMVQGDSMRKIHWKLSARLNDWQVRHDEQGPQPLVQIHVFPDPIDLNAELLMDQRDDFLSYVATQIDSFMIGGLRLALGPYQLIEKRQLDQAQVYLARLEVNHSRRLRNEFDFKQHAIYIVFIQTLTKEIVGDCALLQQNNNHVILYCYNLIQDKELVKLAQFNHLTLVLRKNYE